jgi:protein-arginine kinase activator protein McsA
MKIKLSPTYEGKCDICKKNKLVFTAGDEDTHRTVSICESCSKNIPNKMLSDVIEEYGKKDEESFKPGVRRLDKGAAG